VRERGEGSRRGADVLHSGRGGTGGGSEESTIEADGLPPVSELRALHDAGIELTTAYATKMRQGAALMPARKARVEVQASRDWWNEEPQGRGQGFRRFAAWAPELGSAAQRARAVGSGTGGGACEFEQMIMDDIEEEKSDDDVEPEGIAAGEFRAATLSKTAAEKLYMVLPVSSHAHILGMDEAGMLADGPEQVKQDVLDHLGRMSAGKLDGVRTTLALLVVYLTARRGRSRDAALEGAVAGSHVVGFLEDVHKMSEKKQLTRPTKRQGKTAAPRRARNLIVAARECGMGGIGMDAAVVKTWCKHNKVASKGAAQAPMLMDSMVVWLHDVVDAYGDELPGAMAASFLACMYFVVRAQLAARSGMVSIVEGMAVGMAGMDFKKPAGTPGHDGRPMVAVAAGVAGARSWAETFIKAVAPVKERFFMVRDVNSPSGDPYSATGWGAPNSGVERPMPYKRQLVALQALLLTALPGGPPPYSQEAAKEITLHSLKRKVPAWTAIAYPVSPTAVVETGAWAGAQLAGMDSEQLMKAVRGMAVALHYAAEGAAASAPAVARNTAMLVRAWLAESGGRPPMGDAAAADLVRYREARRNAHGVQAAFGLFLPPLPAVPHAEAEVQGEEQGARWAQWQEDE
jgi:hypothetical protein